MLQSMGGREMQRKRPSASEEILIADLRRQVGEYLQKGYSPYHIAQALGRVRWDVLSDIKAARREGVMLPRQFNELVQYRRVGAIQGRLFNE